MAAQEQLSALTTDHLQADLKGHAIRGVTWTLSSQCSLLFLQSASTMVLARLLTPSDFGLVAMVTAISDLATPFADLGLSPIR
jgi:PST family polysaccharide transporter